MKEIIFKINSPPLRTEDLYKLNLAEVYKNRDVRNAYQKTNERYLHWEDLRFKDWIPLNIFSTKELFWTFIKADRMFRSRFTPIKDVNGNYFRMIIDSYQEFLHLIDKEMAASFMGISELTETNKKQFIARNVIDEAIASSQLEGANTSRAIAKKMLLEGRKPGNISEQMIINTYKTMQKIEQELCHEKLSLELIYELHKMITYKTIAEDKQGILRDTFDEKGNELTIKPWDHHTVAYVAPPKEFVEEELSKLLDFANDKNQQEYGFIHPLIKAIMLHFWIGLLHPFEDGNGRLARILFYWYMLKNEYWAFAYLSLSMKIKKSPVQYSMAFVNSEQDDNDLSYFIHYNIEKLKLAREEFKGYIKNKIDENRLTANLSKQYFNLNERQIKLLQYLNYDMEQRTNIATHQNLYSISKQTAINDIYSLVKSGFLEKQRQGRKIFYYPTEKIKRECQIKCVNSR